MIRRIAVTGATTEHETILPIGAIENRLAR